MSSSLPRLVLTGFAHRLLAVPAVWGAARLWVWPHVPFCFYAAVPWLSVLLGWHFCAAPTTAVGHWTSVSHGSYSLSCLWTGYILSLLLRVCVCVCCAAGFDAGHTASGTSCEPLCLHVHIMSLQQGPFMCCRTARVNKFENVNHSEISVYSMCRCMLWNWINLS